MSRQRYSHSRYKIAESVSFTQEEFLFAKHKGLTIYRDEIKVRCGANFHRIRLNFPGPIELLNHTDRKQEQMLMRLGGEKPDCLCFLEQWKKGIWQHETTRPLVTKLSVAKDKITSSRKLLSYYNDWLELPIYDRLLRRLGQVYHLTKARLDEKFTDKDRQQGHIYRSYHNTIEAPDDKHNEVLVPRLRLEFVDVRKATAKVQDI